MKKIKLFLAAFAVLFGMSTYAQSWTASEVGEGKYLMYNVGKGQFFTKGNGWGTQASTTASMAEALEVELVPRGDYYLIRTLVFSDPTWGLECLDGVVVYTDQSRGKESTWEFALVGTDNGPVYNLITRDNQGNNGNTYPGLYLSANDENTIVGVAENGTNDFAQWKLLPSEMAPKIAFLDNYEALKKEVLALSSDIDVTAADALADAATDETGFNEALNALRQAASDYLSATVVAEPKDITNVWIVNAAPYANGYGWVATNGERHNQWASNPVTYDAGQQCAETWNNTGASMKQTLYNLPAGEYTLSAIAFTRTDFEATLSAGEASVNLVTVGGDVVNDRAGANNWFNEGNGLNELPFTLNEPAETLEIGLTSGDAPDAWMVWRSFSLTYKSLATVVDGISTVETTAPNSDALFDLQGRRVAQPTKGLYIVNGKKVIK